METQRVFIILIAATIGCTPVVLRAQGDAGDAEFNVSRLAPLGFGKGFDSVRGIFRGNCMEEPKPGDIEPLSKALSSWYSFRSVDTVAEASELLDVSVSAKGSFVGGGAGFASDYLKSRTFNSYNLNAVLDLRIITAARVWRKPKLTAQYEGMRARDPLGFWNTCGDRFVEVIADGGQMTAVVEMATTAEESKASTKFEFRGNLGTIEAQAKMTQELRQKVTTRVASIRGVREGGYGDLPEHDIQKLIEAAQKFPEQVRADPVQGIRARVVDYGILGSPVGIDAGSQAYLARLFQAYRDAELYFADLKFMLENRFEFRTIEPARGNAALSRFVTIHKDRSTARSGDFTFKEIPEREIRDLKDAYLEYLIKLRELGQKCISDPSPRNRKCVETIPGAPARFDRATRVFEKTHPHVMASSRRIYFDPGKQYLCKLTRVTGEWSFGSAEHGYGMQSCGNFSGTELLDGHALDFNQEVQFQDNRGTCTFSLTCGLR